MQELQAFNEWYQVSGVGYWLATISSLIWSAMYFWLVKRCNKQMVRRGELMDYYVDKAKKAKKAKDRDGYLMAVRVLQVEQKVAPRGVIWSIKSWLKEKSK